MTNTATRTARLDLRMTPENRELINQAATLGGTSVSDYVMSVLIPAARRDLLEHRMTTLSPDAWEDFVNIIEDPDNSATQALLSRTTRWDSK